MYQNIKYEPLSELSNRNVMLIEDDLELQVLYDKLITRVGYTICHKSRSAEKALTYYFHLLEKPSIIISDFHLAGQLTGLDMAQSILTTYPHQKFVLMTGDTSLITKNLTTKVLQSIPILFKPFSLKELLHSFTKLT